MLKYTSFYPSSNTVWKRPHLEITGTTQQRKEVILRMFRRKLLSSALIVSLGFTAGVTLMSAPALAAADCDATVIDSAGILGDGTTQVEEASEALNSVGADVRVRTYQSFAPYSTLDEYIGEIQKGCGSWTAPDGASWKSNIVIFAMTMDERSVGIFYGSKWDNAFSGANSEARIWGDFMVPQFQGGDFTQGFVDGINETTRVLNEYLHPSQAQPSGGGESDSNAGWIVLIIFLSLVGLALLGFVVYLIIRWQRRYAERRAMRLRGRSARDRASTLIGQVGDPNRQAVRKAKIVKYAQADETVAGHLHSAEAALEDAYTRATDGMASAGSAEADVDDNGLTINEYEVLVERYEVVLQDAKMAAEEDAQIDIICDAVDEQVEHLDTVIEDLRHQHDGLTKSLAKLAADGIVVTTIQTAADKAKQLLDQGTSRQRDLAALNDIDKAKEAITSAKEALQSLEDNRSELKTGLPELKNRIETVRNQLDEAKESFERIASTYVESSWESVAGNGTEAVKRIAAAETLLTEATDDADLKQQHWKNAVKKMEQGNVLLDQAESVLRSIIALEANLATAKAEAPEEIAAAQADILKAQQYIDAHDADVDDEHKDEVRRAIALLNDAKKELDKSQPDYLMVIKSALAANSLADSIFAEAADEFETAERLRRQAVSSVREAAAAVSKANEYIEDHRRDVKSGAKEKLAQASNYLTAAEQGTDPQSIIQLANSAEQMADEAYEQARKNFRSAEDDRDREERRRRESSSSSSSSYSSWGSSSSSSSDSFSSFGGSSGSFGGGGGGGGSSGSW
jgi:uncharacterized membrane protein YgcG